MKDSTFYNTESGTYSSKRYPKTAHTFTQFFFKERLCLTLHLLQKYLPKNETASLLEIGCADGVVVRAIYDRFSTAFTRIDAVDAAPQMIEVAKAHHAETSITFAVRNNTVPLETHTVIIEIGVLNYTALEAELAAVARALAPGGVYLCSLVDMSSLQNTLIGKDGFMHIQSQSEYKKQLYKYFNILQTVPVGFFVPWLWKLPAVAHVVQPVIEQIGRTLAPNLAHEKIYVLATKK